MADCLILRLASLHNTRGISRVAMMLSFSGIQEPRAPTTSGRTVPRWPYFSLLPSAARYRFTGSSKGIVTVDVDCCSSILDHDIGYALAILWPSSCLTLGTASIPRSQRRSVRIVCIRSCLPVISVRWAWQAET